MNLSKKALDAISDGKTGIKLKLALALKCSEGSINRYIRENDDELTKAAAIEVIQKEMGFQYEEIIKREDVAA
ncbi:hypothetical protein [Flavitalea sp.]|nr:hypothetical protein [Flavitalea sp.]